MKNHPSHSPQLTEWGGKAMQLQRLMAEGMPVPPFEVLSCSALKGLFDTEQPKSWWAELNALVDSCDFSDPGALLKCSEKIRQGFMHAPLHAHRWLEIQQQCQEGFGLEYTLAVRSSAVEEDSGSYSFAGLHSTFLFVTPNRLEEAIRESAASTWSFGALNYRIQNKLPLHDVGYAIILQQMVDPIVSGVAFSMHANGNMVNAVVSAGYGLGEGIVSDRISTDTFFIHRNSQEISRQIVAKSSGLYHKEGGKLVELPIAENKHLLAALTDDQLKIVFRAAMKAEQLLKHPADIEFSFDKNGKFFMLQMRPISTIDPKRLAILDNTNIVESYPGISLPLTFSFVRRAYEILFSKSAATFGLSRNKQQVMAPVFRSLVAHYYGNIYYRLDNWYRMTALVYQSRRSVESWKNAVGLTDADASAFRFSFWGRLRAVLRVLRLLLFYKRNNRQFFLRFDKEYAFFKEYKRFASSPQELYTHFETAMKRTFDIWPQTLVNDFLAFRVFGWLQQFLKKYNLGDNPELAHELITGSGEVESEMAVKSLLELKESIGQSQELTSLFEQNTQDVLLALKGGYFSEFYLSFQQYLERFGDRTLSELKLETISPRQDPLLLISLLKSQISHPLTREGFETRQQQLRLSAEKKISMHLKPYTGAHLVFRILRNLAAYGLKNRENMRFCRTRVFALSRECLLACGRLMMEAGCLANERDVFYLEMDEVRSFCVGNDLSNHSAEVEKRKQLYAGFAALDLPDRIIYAEDGAPPPIINTNRNTEQSSAVLQGTAVSSGVVEGEALVLLEPALNADVRGKILVCRMTDPGWVFLMSQALALVTEKGSLLSHTAIVGREMGIPIVVAVADATAKIKTGDRLRVNGATGEVEKC